MNPKNRTKYRSLDRVAADPRVREIWSEEGSEDGLWISLAPGYNWEGAGCVHEWSVKDLLASFRIVSEGEPY